MTEDISEKELKESLSDTMMNREIKKTKGILVESHNGKKEKKEDNSNVLTSTTIP